LPDLERLNVILSGMDTTTTTTLREGAKAALRRNDQLGFDTLFGALCAILAYDDWAQRWEIPDTGDRIAIARWRRAHLAQGRSA
jgi:hypothetical protein